MRDLIAEGRGDIYSAAQSGDDAHIEMGSGSYRFECVRASGE